MPANAELHAFEPSEVGDGLALGTDRPEVNAMALLDTTPLEAEVEGSSGGLAAGVGDEGLVVGAYADGFLRAFDLRSRDQVATFALAPASGAVSAGKRGCGRCGRGA